jgi:hypothetical protein
MEAERGSACTPDRRWPEGIRGAPFLAETRIHGVSLVGQVDFEKIASGFSGGRWARCPGRCGGHRDGRPERRSLCNARFTCAGRPVTRSSTRGRADAAGKAPHNEIRKVNVIDTGPPSADGWNRPPTTLRPRKANGRPLWPRLAAVALLLGPAVAACTGGLPPGPPPSAPPTTAAPTSPPTTAPPPTSEPGPPPARNRYPGTVLDLSDWYLTLPSGRKSEPDNVYQPDLATYTDKYFHLNPAGDGVVFTANAGGATTEGSKYPRSELREMSGDQKASWSNRTGVHTLSVRQAVTRLPQAKPDVVTAQIHDAEDDVMEVRLEGERLLVEYEDGDGEVVIDPAYRLGTPYDLRIIAADSRVQVFYNGVPGAELPLTGSGWYFKSGSYVQSNPDRGDTPEALGEVVIYSLQVTHTG